MVSAHRFEEGVVGCIKLLELLLDRGVTSLEAAECLHPLSQIFSFPFRLVQYMHLIDIWLE